MKLSHNSILKNNTLHISAVVFRRWLSTIVLLACSGVASAEVINAPLNISAAKPVPATTSNHMASQAIEQLSEKLAGMTSLSAGFSQQTISNRGQILQEITGQLEVMQSNRLRWQTEPPFEQLVVADGSDVWVFDRDLEQVTVRTMDNSFQETPALLLSGNVDRIADEFMVQSVSDEIFNLTPIDDSQLFERLTLIFEQDILQTLTIFDVTGQHTLIELNDTKINLALPAEHFRFTPPVGVDVIDGR